MDAYHLYHRSPELSDIDITYTVLHQQSTQPRASKRRRHEPTVTRYPGHRLALSGNSGVMRTEIEAGATVIEIVLEDEADVPAADAMVAVMYGVPDALQDTEQSVVLRMALLANKYDAPKVLSTAIQHLERKVLDEAALELFWQLEGCWQQPFWPLVPQAVQHKLASTAPGTAADRVQAVTELLLCVCDRDLEAVWADSSSVRRDLLMSLPVEVLAAFLQSSDLRVVSEDTVLYTVVKRTEVMMQIRPRLSTAALDEQRGELMSAVRLPHLSAAGLSYIAPELPWLSPKECLKAAFVRNASASMSGRRRMDVPAHWLLERRGRSPRTSQVLEFTTSLASVQRACAKVLAAAEGLSKANVHLTCSSSSTFAGRQWDCKLQVARQEGGVVVGVFVGPTFPLLSPAASNEVPWVTQDLCVALGSTNWRMSGLAGNAMRGYRNVLGLMSSPDAWAAPDWAENGKVVVRVTVFAGNVV